MSFRCPGYLNAKSLSEGGDCREDYVEWFFNPVLSQYRHLIDAVYRTMQYRGDDPVLLVCDISAEACLLFRFTMKSQDRKGRNHQRCEVMKVDQSKLPMLLNGEFNAVPDASAKVFVVDGVDGDVLPQWRQHRVKNEILSVYTRNPKAYWFKNEEPVQIAFPRQKHSNEAKQSVRSGRAVIHPKERKNMNKVLFALLIVSCAFCGWIFFQLDRLRTNLDHRTVEIRNCHREIDDLQVENRRLKEQINKYDKWVKTRSNFELNKIKLKNKFSEIVEKFHEAENLWGHIDESPSQTSTDEGCEIFSKRDPRIDKVVLRKDDKKPNPQPGSSGQRPQKSEDKESEESWFVPPLEKVKNILK